MKQKTFSFFIIVIIFFGIISSLGNTANASGWLSSWGYQRALTVSGIGTALSDFQGSFTVDTQAIISSKKMRADCGDIRFTDTDGITLLSYWIESGCNSASTKIWIKIPSIPAGGETIYLYYGNTTAISTSSSKDTFVFFDDFESGDLSKWDVSVTGGVPYGITTDDKHSGLYSRFVGPSACSSGCLTSFIVNFTSKEPVNSPADSYIFSYWRHETYDWGGEIIFITNTANIQQECGGCNNNSDSGWSQKTFIYTGVINGLTIIDSDLTNAEKIYFDDLRVRKYASTDPIISMEIETLPTIPLIAPTGGLIPCGRMANAPPAQGETDLIDESKPCDICAMFYLLKKIINFITELSIGIGVFILIIAGLLYATSAGDSHLTEKAKEAATSVIIGLAIISIAWLVIAIILQGMGYSSFSTWHQINCALSK